MIDLLYEASRAGVKVDLAAVWGGVPRLPVRKLADGSTTLLKSGVPFNLSDPTNGGLYDMTYSKAGYFGPHGNNLSLLLRSADRRLQLGKRDGRNRVIARDI